MVAQLFHILHQVDVSHDSHYDPVGKVFAARRLVVPATFAVTWPDGWPCSLVEMYLVSQFRRGASVREDGGSLRATVAKISHLIRHCWLIKKEFWELEDEHVDQLILKLIEDKRATAPMIRVRDNNTVRAIIAAVVQFLLWLQEEIFFDLKLIGVGPEYRIRLLERKEYLPHKNRYVVQLRYHRLPPRDTKEPKRPISNEKRNLLWQAVGKISNEKIFLPRWAKDSDYAEMLQIYLKARRELLLELLEATGARPGELSRLRVSCNEDCYKSQELVLITLKRRRHFERKIKLQPGVAMRLTIFLKKYRALLIKVIKTTGSEVDPQDRVFLGISGFPITERSMTTEFSRISQVAGLSEYQSCMSMFRHRFITKQVAIHLGIYLSERNKVKELMTNGDYRTILKKVATITGHGSESSLLRYIDLAWDELGAGNQVEKAMAVDASLESAIRQVISLKGEFRSGSKKYSSDFEIKVLGILEELRIEMQSVLRISKD